MTRVNPRAADALGTLGVIFWSIQVLPQIWKSHKSGSTKGLSAWLMVTWAAASAYLARPLEFSVACTSVSGCLCAHIAYLTVFPVQAIPLGTYNIVQGFNIPLIIQPQAFCALCACSWAQVLHYSHGLSRLQAFAAWLAFVAAVGVLQVAFVYACRAGERNGTTAPTTLFGALSAVMILGGLAPQYYEIWKFKAVFGISLIFIFIDLLGGLVACLSLVFQREFDWLASVTYGGLVVLEAGIFLAAAILNPRAKRRSVRDGEHVDTADGPDMSQTGSRLGPSDPEASQVADSALPSAAASSENDTSTSMDAEHHHRLPPV